MPKKRPLEDGVEYLEGRTKEAEKALLWATLAWKKYLKKSDPLRVELEDLYRRFQLFNKAATKFVKKSS